MQFPLDFKVLIYDLGPLGNIACGLVFRMGHERMQIFFLCCVVLSRLGPGLATRSCSFQIPKRSSLQD